MNIQRQRGLSFFILFKPSWAQGLMWLTPATCCLLPRGSPGKRAEQTAFYSGVVGVFWNSTEIIAMWRGYADLWQDWEAEPRSWSSVVGKFAVSHVLLQHTWAFLSSPSLSLHSSLVKEVLFCQGSQAGCWGLHLWTSKIRIAAQMSSREGFRFRDDFIVEQGRDLSGRMRMDRIFGTAHPAEQRLCGYSCSLEGLIPAGKGCAQPAHHRCQRGQQTPLVSIPTSNSLCSTELFSQPVSLAVGRCGSSRWHSPSAGAGPACPHLVPLSPELLW